MTGSPEAIAGSSKKTIMTAAFTTSFYHIAPRYWNSQERAEKDTFQLKTLCAKPEGIAAETALSRPLRMC